MSPKQTYKKRKEKKKKLVIPLCIFPSRPCSNLFFTLSRLIGFFYLKFFFPDIELNENL